MPALTTRQKARARILATLTAELDRMIPEDETIPLKGATFLDFEDQVETVARSTLPVILEERAALEANAKVQEAGRCPHCGSDRVYLKKETTQTEIRSPWLRGDLPAARAMPSLQRLFFPLRFVTGDCRRRLR